MRDRLLLGRAPRGGALVRDGRPDVVDGVDVEEGERFEGDGGPVAGEDDVQVAVGCGEGLGRLGVRCVEGEGASGRQRCQWREGCVYMEASGMRAVAFPGRLRPGASDPALATATNQ